jgi:hypothetical protein
MRRSARDALSKHAVDSTDIDLDEGPIQQGIACRQREHKATKQDLKREAATLQLQKTLKELIANKDASNENQEEIRCQKKKDQMINCINV